MKKEKHNLSKMEHQDHFAITHISTVTLPYNKKAQMEENNTTITCQM